MMQLPPYAYQTSGAQPTISWSANPVIYQQELNINSGQIAPQYSTPEKYKIPSEVRSPETEVQDPEPNSEDEEDNKNDPDLQAKFESLAIDDGDKDEHPAELNPPILIAPVSKLEPKRHSSEIPRLESEWKSPIPYKISPEKIPERRSAHSPRTSKTNVNSSLSETSFGLPPGLPTPLPKTSPQPQSQSFYAHPYSYSSNNVIQPLIQTGYQYYQMPGYYLCQPAVIPMPMQYACYPSYPQQMTYKTEPKRYFSSKQQPYIGNPLPNIVSDPEQTEYVLTVIKEYEDAKDYKKLSGHIAKLARLQSGSRFLQKEIEKADGPLLAFVLHEVFLIVN